MKLLGHHMASNVWVTGTHYLCTRRFLVKLVGLSLFMYTLNMGILLKAFKNTWGRHQPMNWVWQLNNETLIANLQAYLKETIYAFWHRCFVRTWALPCSQSRDLSHVSFRSRAKVGWYLDDDVNCPQKIQRPSSLAWPGLTSTEIYTIIVSTSTEIYTIIVSTSKWCTFHYLVIFSIRLDWP